METGNNIDLDMELIGVITKAVALDGYWYGMAFPN